MREPRQRGIDPTFFWHVQRTKNLRHRVTSNRCVGGGRAARSRTALPSRAPKSKHTVSLQKAIEGISWIECFLWAKAPLAPESAATFRMGAEAMVDGAMRGAFPLQVISAANPLRCFEKKTRSIRSLLPLPHRRRKDGGGPIDGIVRIFGVCAIRMNFFSQGEKMYTGCKLGKQNPRDGRLGQCNHGGSYQMGRKRTYCHPPSQGGDAGELGDRFPDRGMMRELLLRQRRVFIYPRTIWCRTWDAPSVWRSYGAGPDEPVCSQ